MRKNILHRLCVLYTVNLRNMKSPLGLYRIMNKDRNELREFLMDYIICVDKHFLQ